DDPRLLNIIRFLKDDTSWDPLLSGTNGSQASDYNYGLNGSTRNSQRMDLSIESIRQAGQRIGYGLHARYHEIWGPFPNQQTTRLHGLLNANIRLGPSHQVVFSLLGLDNGWHVRPGNHIYADRARYILEHLNLWRSRSGGFGIEWSGTTSRGLNYGIRTHSRFDQWRSDPRESSALLSVSDPPVFLDGLIPATPSPAFSASREYLSFLVNGHISYQINDVHLVDGEVAFRRHRYRQVQSWHAQVVPDAFGITVNPHELSLSITDRLRFGALLMDVGVRYDRFDFGDVLWQDVYRTLGDDRAIEESVRQVLLGAGGTASATNLLSPRISLSYPSRRWTAHMAFGVMNRIPTLEDRYRTVDTPSSLYANRSVTDLSPQRLTTVEGGIGIARREYTADVTAFYRDSERYFPVLGPEVLPQAAANYGAHWGRVDHGFRKQAGIEVSLVRRLLPLKRSRTRFSASLSYLYLKDIGAVRQSDRPLRPSPSLSPGDFTTFDHTLNSFWNRHHWFNVNGTLRFSNGTLLSAIGHLQSGTPYQRPITAGLGQVVTPGQEPATAFGSWRRTIDGRIDVPVLGAKSMPIATLFIEVRNLLNDVNVDVVADPRLYEKSGQPDNKLLNQIQWVYGPARAIWTGVKIQW
ncbi:MAG: TonB-dependent receptor, partial [Candidatus Latescibacteria bacterium]|nr:TonB-dependent receptor [Candidatus Latescibacterota bacterium]